MKQNTALMLFAILLFVSFASYVLYEGGYKMGEFGNYYIEQEVWKGRPSTWVWHNDHIFWSKIHDIKEFNDSTFIKDKSEAEKAIIQFQKAEKLLP